MITDFDNWLWDYHWSRNKANDPWHLVAVRPGTKQSLHLTLDYHRASDGWSVRLGRGYGKRPSTYSQYLYHQTFEDRKPAERYFKEMKRDPWFWRMEALL